VSERWRPVVGWEDGYEVSDRGHIRSLRDRHGRRRSQLLRSQCHSHGYPQVNLSIRGRRRTCLVHRLVLEAFAGPCPPGHMARHLDGDPTKSTLANLTWGTALENQQDRVPHGTHSRGEQCKTSKLTAANVNEIRRSDEPGIVLARRFGVTNTNISRIRLRQSWKHI